MERIAVAVAALVFGPVLIGAFANAVWPGVSNLLQYIFWIVVAVGAAIALFVLAQKYSALNADERRQQATEDERKTLVRKQREELAAIFAEVNNAYRDIFDRERQRSSKRIGP